MSHNERNGMERWLGLAAVAVLLAVCLVLLAGQAAAQQGPPPQRPEWHIAAGDLLGADHLASPLEQGDWDGFRVAWPCVISDTTVYRMWYGGNNPSAAGYGWQIGMATSADGTAWTKSASNPVLGVGALGAWDDMYRGQVACMVDGGTYKIWYTGGTDGPWQTGYATSTDGVAWNVYPGNPVLPAGPPGSWDEMESDMPAVIKDGGTYKMWYLGCDAGYTACSIGYATSPDGMAWTKHTVPVLTGTAGEWDKDFVWGPRVIKNGSTYEMWYHSNDQIGLATSTDGINWTKYLGNPVLTEGWDGAAIWGAWVLLEGSAYKMWANSGTGATQGIGYATSPDGIAWTMYGGNPVLTPGAPGLFADVNYDHDWIELRTLPDTTVAVTVANGGGAQYTTGGTTDGGGWFATWQADWDPERPDIAPGDVVSATGDGLTTYVNPVGRIDAAVDLDADTVAGTVHAPWFAPQTLTVRCEVWTEGGPGIDVPGVDPDDGSFTCDFGAIGWDLEPGPDVAVRYLEPDGDSVIAVPPSLQPFITADYGDDWVNGEYEAGHTVWITVTESDGTTVKATAEVTSREYPEWGGWTGFATQGEDWLPTRLDMQPGDWVEVLVDTGYGNTVHVGTIDGESDVDTDVVSGTIHADWLSPYTVTVSCEIHEENGPSIQVEGVDPDGGSFECDFTGEWDILPGHNVAVNYIEPDTDRVQTHFREPSPDLHMEKWAEGSGQAMPGSNLVYTLRYRNEGNAPSGTILLTDTLPLDTAYVANSSGMEPVQVGNQLVWTLGPLDPEREVRFHLVLSNMADPGDTLTNQADISTLYDFNQGNNHAEADIQVATEGQPDLYVGKNREADEPSPGETMLYRIDYGNNGPVASGPVVLTDTLPEYTTVVTWWSQNGYDLWAEQSRDGELVLTLPSIPGNWGDQLYLRVQVAPDAPPDTELYNRVDIYTEGDSNTDDNWSERSDWTRERRGNAGVNKEFGWGATVPGGEGEYWLDVRNHGNFATSVILTETLPAGTSFLHSRRWTGSVEVPFPPDYVDDQVAVWDLGLMEPGDWYNVNVRLSYDSDLKPGTLLKNCATVSMDGQDTWPFDDKSCAEVPIRVAGTNVSVSKRAQWNWEGRIRYEIRFRNLGTTTLNNLVITDILPTGTSFSGNQWNNFWEDVQFSQDGDELSWTLSRLEPEWASEIYFEADLDSELIYDQGLAFTNTVEAPVTGDVYPTDNQHELVTYTGPDLYAEKWLSEGELLPGERITLTVRFGNQTPWPWRVDESATVRLRERLPAGMTYVAAYWPDGNLNEPWDYDPVSGVVVWDFGSLGSDDHRAFYLVIDLDPDIALGNRINRLEIYEPPPPPDIDPVPGNNTFDYPMHIGRPLYLPLVMKNK
jgi:uncharacterized repeat protein (TIGR01451 family)